MKARCCLLSLIQTYKKIRVWLNPHDSQSTVCLDCAKDYRGGPHRLLTEKASCKRGFSPMFKENYGRKAGVAQMEREEGCGQKGYIFGALGVWQTSWRERLGLEKWICKGTMRSGREGSWIPSNRFWILVSKRVERRRQLVNGRTIGALCAVKSD